MPDRIVLLHGFTQTGASWGAVATRLAAGGFAVEAPDLPGHGTAGALRLDLPGTADHLASLAGRPGTWVGYSMGGRVALHVAVRHPHLVERLVLVSSTAGLDEAPERRARVSADEALAAGMERDGLEAFLDRWLALPLFAGLPASASGREARLTNTVEGLASSLRLAGTGTMDPLWDQLQGLDVPTLVVVGADDAKFRDLGGRLRSTIGSCATLATVVGAGHTVHLERPDAFWSLLGPWLGIGTARP